MQNTGDDALTIKIVIKTKEERTREEEKKKGQQKLIQNS